MKDKQIIQIIEKHIENYDIFSDSDLERVNIMKKCVNSLSGLSIYKEEDK